MGISWNEEIRYKIALNTRDMGAEIIKRKGKTHFGIATCVSLLADAILNSCPTIVSVTSVLSGEYGMNGVALSVPSIVGKNGVEKRIKEKWDNKEYSEFYEVAKKFKLLTQQVDLI